MSSIGAYALMATPALAQSNRETLSGKDVAIYNVAGDVRVESGSGTDVTIEMTRGGRDADRLKVVTGTVRGRNAYRVVYPTGDDIIYSGARASRWGSTDVHLDSDGTWGGSNRGWRGNRVRVRSSGRGTEAWADLVIRVPAGKSVAVYLVAGTLSATRVDADLVLDVASARVEATGTRGRLSIDAGSGAVDVRDASGAALKVDNGSGGITLNNVSSDDCNIDTGSGGVGGTGVQCGLLKVDVGSGGVRLDGVSSGDVDVDAGSGSVRLAMTSAPKRVHLEAGSGSVTLALPPSAGADVSIDTGSGGISSEFAVRATRMDRDELRGTIGDGSGRIRISTGSGSVRLIKNIN
jgi:DUF4097 and DUF4098 domain-containing protein YvlB